MPKRACTTASDARRTADAITFVRETEGLDFADAVERLAARAGITITRVASGGRDEDRGRRRELLAVLEKAAAFYHEQLLNHPDAGRARNYLRSRGYDGDVVRKFRLGYAPAAFDALAQSLKAPPALLRQAGLAFENQRGRTQDSFRDRVMFPIFDAGGQPIAFGGRVLPERLRATDYEAGPKYRNSPESPIYQKRRTLYGLNWAKKEIARTEEAVVCEGYTDVIGFHLAGVPQAVATCGTALTEDHFQVLAHFAKRVVLAFDADAAGEAAASAPLSMGETTRDRTRRGRAARGADPAELARAPNQKHSSRRSATRDRSSAFASNVPSPRRTSARPKAAARAAEEATAAIAEHPNELVRDQYLIDVADRTQIPPDRLRALVASAPSGTSKTGDQRGPADESGEGDRSTSGRHSGASPGSRRSVAIEQNAARDALVCAIERRDDARSLFDEVLFLDPIQRAAFVALVSTPDLAMAINSADPDVSDLFARARRERGAR